MPSALAVGTRVEQSGEFLPRASRAGRRHPEGLADSLHRLPQAAEDLQVFIPRRNRPLLLQGEFRITLYNYTPSYSYTPSYGYPSEYFNSYGISGGAAAAGNQAGCWYVSDC